MSDTNRSKLARGCAGLSLGQAAKLFNITAEELREIEDSEKLTDNLEPLGVIVLAATYGCSVEWITGVVKQHDYKSIDKIKGADKLSTHDRDVLAEFAAMLPMNTRTADMRLKMASKKHS